MVNKYKKGWTHSDHKKTQIELRGWGLLKSTNDHSNQSILLYHFMKDYIKSNSYIPRVYLGLVTTYRQISVLVTIRVNINKDSLDITLLWDLHQNLLNLDQSLGRSTTTQTISKHITRMCCWETGNTCHYMKDKSCGCSKDRIRLSNWSLTKKNSSW